MTKYIIRDDQIENLRLVVEKIKHLHGGAALVLEHTLDAVENNPLGGINV